MRFTSFVFPLLLSACSASVDEAASSDQAVMATSYVDTMDFWKTGDQQDAWTGLRNTLDSQFNDVCGDTFCEGDYSNLVSLGFTCSVTSGRGDIKDCMWVFSGSSVLVNPKTGSVDSNIPSFQCDYKPKGTIKNLVSLLSAPGTDTALNRVLPGMTTSLYDGLVDCFQHPVDSKPVSPIYTKTPSYVDSSDWAFEHAVAWDTAVANLKTGFDNICGDTYCDGDYPNIQSLGVFCSVTPARGLVHDCEWLFAGSYNSIDAKTGLISVHDKAARCNLPVKTNLTSLANTLAAAGNSAIDLPLPTPTSESAYDAIGGCVP